jgi:glycolate oxidase FAD binding subunit
MNDRNESKLARELGAIVGAAQVRLPAGHESLAASLIVEPRNSGEVAEVVRKCEADALTLAPLGAARTLAQIRPAPVAVGISLARMNRIIAYEPDDMTVIAEAGLTLAALNGVTAPRAQWLPADPPHPDRTTLGALVAAARAGPIRLSEGTVRDLLIGIRFVGHDARLVHGGGQVVKNVAGYDLMKVMTGSFGTLGIVTETTFKVRPIPERYTVAIARFRDPDAAFAAAAALHDVAALIHLEVVSGAAANALRFGGQACVIAGFGGNEVEAAHLRAQASAILGPATELLTDAQAKAVYEGLRDFAADEAALVAQIAVPPGRLAQCLKQCRAEFRAHAGCGVAQIFISDVSNPDDLRRRLTQCREIAQAERGNLRVIRVAADFRGAVRFFDDPPRAALALMRRLKSAFDPRGIFNPGCFAGGL